MKELTKKHLIIHIEERIVMQKTDNTGPVFPGANTSYFETDDKAEFDKYVIENKLSYPDNQSY